jgi:hypothetical protein
MRGKLGGGLPIAIKVSANKSTGALRSAYYIIPES